MGAVHAGLLKPGVSVRQRLGSPGWGSFLGRKAGVLEAEGALQGSAGVGGP